MRLFNRSKVPKWAAFMAEETYLAFQQKVATLSNGTLDPAKADKNGTVRSDNGEISLVNLAAQCNDLPPADWDAEITRWATAFAQSDDHPTPTYPDDLSMLRLQLYPGDYFTQLGKDNGSFMTREDIPGVITTVVVEWPDSVAAFDIEDEAAWQTHANEVFDHLMTDLRETEPYDVSFVQINEAGDTVALIEDGDIMTAAQVLAFEDIYPQLVGAEGALVGIPSRHMIIAHKIDAMPDESALEHLRGMMQHMAGENHYSTSAVLYHYKHGTFTEV